MKKLAMSVFAAAILSSCGGGEGGSSSEPNKVTTTINSTNERFKGFEQKGSIGYYSGMNFGGKRFQKVLYIAVTDYEKIELNSFSIENPPAKGNLGIVAAIYGPNGDDQKNLKPLTPGKYTTNQDEEGKQFNINVYVNDGGSFPKAESFTGERMTYANKIEGTVDLTEVSDTRAKGKLTYTHEDGHDLTIDFDVAIEKDLWAEMNEKMEGAGLK